MFTQAMTNQRFTELRKLTNLGTEGRYEVRSNGLFGHYNSIGRTDDVAEACAAAELLASHAVPCETFTANESIGAFA